MFLAVLGALVAFTVIILVAANFIGSTLDGNKAEDPMRRAAVDRRIAPIGQVRIAGEPETAAAPPPAAAAVTVAPATAAAAPRSGQEVYQTACFACHGTGAAGAPKVGDQAAWQPRVEEGLAHLVEVAIAGKGAMPARGGNPSLTDEEIRASIVYMLDQTGVAYSETEQPHAPEAEPPGHVEPHQEPQMSAPATEPTPPEVPAAEPATAAVAAVAQPAAAEAASLDLGKGEEVYQAACFACHMTGAAGAPKLGDVAAWAPRIAQGSETLLHSAIHGKGAMPPKGGRLDLSDADITAAVAFIVSKSQ
jgi:cytochrome c5